MAVITQSVAAVVTPLTRSPFSQDGAATDEAYPGQHTKRKAQHIHHGEGVGGLAADGQQKVGLDHADGGCKPDQYRGPQAGGLAMGFTVQADQRAGYQRKEKAKQNLLPAWVQWHVRPLRIANRLILTAAEFLGRHRPRLRRVLFGQMHVADRADQAMLSGGGRKAKADLGDDQHDL
jgi:hypothetical protein